MIYLLSTFTPQVLDRLMTIWLETNIAAHRFIPKSYWHSQQSTVKNLLPQADIYVYEHQGIIQGFIGIINSNYIAGLFIHEPYQQKGIGRQLLSHAKACYSALSLHVYEKNKRAIAFYNKNGFSFTTSQPDTHTQEIHWHMAWEKS